MLKREEETTIVDFNPEEQLNMFPAVVDLYRHKKTCWTQARILSETQLKYARCVNGVLSLIHFATQNGYHNELRGALERYASRRFNSPKDRILIFSMADELLRQGDDALKKISWCYKAHPEVYTEKFALNRSGLRLDRLKKLFKTESSPKYSFLSFAKGENPAFTFNPQVWNKVKMAEELKTPADSNKAYQNWLSNTDAGQQYGYNKMVYSRVLGDLLLQAQDYLGLEEKALKTQKKDGR